MDIIPMPLINLADNQMIRLAEEKDIRLVVAYIHKQKDEQDQFIDPIACDEEHFHVSNIRSNLYQCSEEFLLLEDQDGVQAMILFGINANSNSRVAQVHAVLMNQPDVALLKLMFDSACHLLPVFSIVEPTKLRVQFEKKKNDEAADWWQHAFCFSGFAAEPLRINELDLQHDLLTYVRSIESEAGFGF